MKKWWKSRTIWAGIATIVLASATLMKVMPESINDLFAWAQIVSGGLTIYFRKTTTVGIGMILADTRISGTRVPME